MSNKEKKWFGITRSPEEDLALVDIILSSRNLTIRRFITVMIMSILILGIYVGMNHAFYPGYPVTYTQAEENDLFTERYPPFRMYEWTNYSITLDILNGKLYESGSLSLSYPIGYSLLAVPLTGKWGETGMFYTNAFILWMSALVFFFLMLDIVEFPLAIASTLVLALATPNLFYATSAFTEPTAQLITVLSVFFFVKGMMAQKEWIYYMLCGLVSGLNLFVQPAVSLSIVIFLGLLVYERGKWSVKDHNTLSLCFGFLVTLIIFVTVNKIFPVKSGFIGFSAPDCLYGIASMNIYGQEKNVITGLWKLLFDSPHGLVFLMPFTVLVPMGILVMWRNELRSLTIIIGALLLYMVIFTATGTCPITGDGIGSRQLLPVIPLLVIPLAFIWREQIGEKIWLVATLIMTVYMCSFGWWAGMEKGSGFFTGLLHDRDARYIILARKNRLGQKEFISSNMLVEKYIESLEKGDMKQWLITLDRETLTRIQGFERFIFHRLYRDFSKGDRQTERYIEYVDPDNGIRPVLNEFVDDQEIISE